ncbi:7359_t:CDS:1, partial [Cetraspora pellucida]
MLQTFPENGSVFERLNAMHDSNSSTKDTLNSNNSDDINNIIDIYDNHITDTFVLNLMSKETK